MQFRSIADLAKTIRAQAHRIPAEVDLVVGVPRSGMLAASIVALAMNRNLLDLNSCLSNARITHGRTREVPGGQPDDARAASWLLLVDDSVRTGRSMRDAKEAILRTGFVGHVTTLAVYAAPTARRAVDICLETVSMPRAFEWNVMHRIELADCCVDLDGVLCVDPADDENDDGPRYARFLQNARPLIIPSYPIGHIVTSRLQKYRLETEEWLRDHGVVFGQLHMLDFPSAEIRRRLRPHARFKASVYMSQRATHLFIESEPNQAAEIAQISGKPVLCYGTQQLLLPGFSWSTIRATGALRVSRFSGVISRLGRRWIRS